MMSLSMRDFYSQARVKDVLETIDQEYAGRVQSEEVCLEQT